MINFLKNEYRTGIRSVINLRKHYIKPSATKCPDPPKDPYKPGYTKLIALGLTATAVAAYYRLANTPSERPDLRSIKALPNDVSLREKFNFIGSVVEKCAPAVVYVEIQDPRRIDPETDEPIIVSNGSGFLINSEGWILTNAHVVINKPKAIITAKLNDGTKYTARIEDADMNVDLALIKIDSIRRLPSLKFGKSGDISIGEWVIALGSPLSLSHSVTAGIISSTSRAADELGLRNHSMKYIQTDASITFGNSGGPLVNLDGDVIGINNLRITAGISFAIPIDYAKKFLDNGKYRGANNDSCSEIVHTKQLGMTTLTLTDVILKELHDLQRTSSGDIKNGVLVWKVVSNSPAQKGGLVVGDIITHINGVSVTETVDIYKAIKQQEKLLLKMDIIRKGEKMQILLSCK